jgi:hypothetical protein
MADPRPVDPVLLIVAAFSRHPEALRWARERLEQTFGPIALASEPFDFIQTDYYARTMGVGLRKQFFAFRDLIAPDRLAEIKLITNAFERDLAAAGTWPEPRPLNLDPGILTLGKFHLATTKDQAHRIYLRDGIFAEVTLRFHAGTFEPWPWTYADYRLPAVIAFLNQARDWYRQQLDEQAKDNNSSE